MARVSKSKIQAEQGLQIGTSSTTGHVVTATDTSGNVALQAKPSYTFRTVHTFSMEPITASVNPRFYVSVATGQTASIVKVRASVGAATSATWTLNLNGSAAHATYTGVASTTTNTDSTQSVTLADNDLLELDVTATSGSPTNLTVTVVIQHVVTA